MRFLPSFLILAGLAVTSPLFSQPGWVAKQKGRMEEARAFEAGLGEAEIEAITQDNPRSLFRAMKRAFVLTSPECTDAEYRKIKKKMGASELAARGRGILALASAYESAFVVKYSERILKLLATSPKYAKQRASLSSFYTEGIQELRNLGYGDDREQRIASYERELVEKGVPARGVRRYVFEKASQSPECLGGVNIPFVKIQHVDVTVDRGRYLLGTLADTIRRTGKRPKISADLPVQAGHGVFGENKDSWGNWYRISYAGNRATMYSDGAKGNGNFRIGTIELKE